MNPTLFPLIIGPGNEPSASVVLIFRVFLDKLTVQRAFKTDSHARVSIRGYLFIGNSDISLRTDGE
jgi:hypothetical protein